MRITKSIARMALLALMAGSLAVAGCGDDGDSGNNNGGGGTPVDAATAQQLAVGGLELVNGMLVGIGDLAAGDFSGVGIILPEALATEVGTIDRAGDPCPESPTYDATVGAWTWACTYTEPDFGTYTFDYFIQFLAGGTPQMEPDESTTDMNYDLTLDWDFDFSQEGTTIDYDLLYEIMMAVSGLTTDTYSVDGSGSLEGVINGSSSEGAYNYVISMSWTMDVDVPAAGGCPTGTATVTVGAYTLTATYNGTNSVAWTMTENGTQVGSGTEFISCS